MSKIVVDTYLRALSNNTLPLWYAYRDLHDGKINRKRYKEIIAECRRRNGQG